MITIAVFGANGFVGSSLCSSLISVSKYKVVPITRTSYSEHIGKSYDVVINSAHPAARFRAKNNPEEDFQETVQKTADIFYKCKFEKFVHISTVSARCQLDTVYGRHKLAAENICNDGKSLIVRLGSMFGNQLKKGVLIDMMKGRKVFVDGESRYNFSSVEYITDYISSNLHLKGIIEAGAFNTVRMIDIAKYLQAPIVFEGQIDVQETKNPDPNSPDAKEVFKFLDKMKNQISSSISTKYE